VKNKIVIKTDKAPKAIGPYSQAIKLDKLIFTSGQIPLNPRTGNIISDNFEDQAVQVLKNIKGILLEESLSINHIIKLTVYITDLTNFDKLNSIFENFFSGDYPSRSVVQVSKLPKNSQIEIEAIIYNDK
jgi:2-iminobutanoate/2-iminopropanoate deaminase